MMEETYAMFEFTGVECERDPLVIEDEKPVLACRCCLAAERPLRPLEHALASLYEQLTGIPVSQSDIYPKFLCSYCRALLLKFATFRRKCLSAQETFLYLHSGGITITKDLLNSGVAGSPYPNLMPTFVQLITSDPLGKPAHDYESVNLQTSNESSNNFIENNVLNDFLNFHDKDQTSVSNLDVCTKTENDVEVLDSASDDDASDMPDCLVGINTDIYMKDSTKPFKDDSHMSKAKSVKTQKSVTVKAGKRVDQEHSYSKKNTSFIKEAREWIEKFKAKMNSSKKGINQEPHEDTTTVGDSDLNNSADIAIGNDDDDLSDCLSDTTEMGLQSHSDISSEEDTISLSGNINKESKLKVDSKPLQKVDKSKQGCKKGKNQGKNPKREPGINIKALREFIKKVKSDRNKMKERVIKKSKKERYYEKVRENSCKRFNMTVVQLSEEEQKKQFMERKDAPRYKNARFKCELCYTGFPFEDRYKIHIAEHEPKEGREDFICDICNVRYPASRRSRHKIFHRNNYVCNECGFISNHSQKAAIHYRSHKGTKYGCNICGKTFDRPTSVYGHIHLSHGGSVTCSICGERCVGQKGLHAHINLSHKEAVGAVCPTCSVQFHSHDALRRHRPQDGSCDPTHRPCFTCGEGFLTDETLQQHKKKAHTSKGRKFICEKCGREYDKYQVYKNHMRFHHKPAQKKTIQKISSTSSQVFICEVCGVVKKDKCRLAIHMCTHTKPFQCDYCQRRFSTKIILQQHIYTHMPKSFPRKLYHCCRCPKTFNQYTNVVRHEKTVHLKQQSFACDHCGKTYTYKESLQSHINTKHLGKPWPKRIRNRCKK